MSVKAPNHKIIVVLPAYNAAKTLKNTINDIPREWVDEIILVDDASQDNTIAVAEKLGLKTFTHTENLGYGGNQKTCYQQALKLGADIIIMVHPDHQYDPAYIPQLIIPLVEKKAEAVFGSRMINKKWAREGGMPYWKYLGNIFLTKLENLVLKLNLTEYHSGFRAYSRKILKTVPYHLNSNDFVFDTEIIVQIKINNFKIKEIPIKTRYFKDASSVNLYQSTKYGFSILWTLIKFKLADWDIKKDQQFIKNEN